MRIPILCDWYKNTSKTPILNRQLIRYPRQILPVRFLAVSDTQKASLQLLICVKQQGNQQSPHIFQQSSSG